MSLFTNTSFFSAKKMQFLSCGLASLLVCLPLSGCAGTTPEVEPVYSVAPQDAAPQDAAPQDAALQDAAPQDAAETVPEISPEATLSPEPELSPEPQVSPEPTAVPKALQAEPVEDPEIHYDFSLGFAGDINFADDYIPMGYLAALGSENISDGIDQEYIDIMKRMDLMWINNEFTYSERGEPLPGKAFTFRSSPSHVSYLKDLGIDIVGLANNHTFDYGELSLLDTLDTLDKAGIPHVGAGRNIEEAASPVYLETNGFTIAYVAASCAEQYIYTPEATESTPGILLCVDDTRFLDSIRTASENADYVIALPHWGTEQSTWLLDKQRDSARAYIDAGADAVIGAHPHILQGIEYYSGKPILYSLGNFWFDNYDIDTVVAELHFTGTTSRDNPSLKDTVPELIVYPGTQTGSHTYIAANDSWENRILRYIETISQYGIQIDENRIVHEVK